MTVRIGIVGARRNRQGLGPYMARFFHDLGAEVTAVLGTSLHSAQSAAEGLASAGISARAFADAATFLACRDIDAVAIASPHETHASCLERALEHGKHVLCEKPIVWGTEDPVGDSARIAEAFVDRRLVLRENVQWPYTLAPYRELFPDRGLPGDRVDSLDFLLGPAARDSGRISDSMSHVLSVLQVLAPSCDEPLQDIRLTEEGSTELHVHFDYPGTLGTIATRVTLRHAPTPPRPAGYGIDGRFAHRQIDPETYQMSFLDREDGSGRSVPIPDPMRALIRDFVSDVEGARHALDDGAHSTGPAYIAPRMRNLIELHTAYEATFG